jgi:hypothetical protein
MIDLMCEGPIGKWINLHLKYQCLAGLSVESS